MSKWIKWAIRMVFFVLLSPVMMAMAIGVTVAWAYEDDKTWMETWRKLSPNNYDW